MQTGTGPDGRVVLVSQSLIPVLACDTPTDRQISLVHCSNILFFPLSESICRLSKWHGHRSGMGESEAQCHAVGERKATSGAMREGKAAKTTRTTGAGRTRRVTTVISIKEVERRKERERKGVSCKVHHAWRRTES